MNYKIANYLVNLLLFCVLGLVMIFAFEVMSEVIKQGSRTHEAVENSSWDDSVGPVKTWLEAHLKDPDSLQFEEWSPVHKLDSGGFMVRVKYRAKNSFGGYVVENKVFYLDRDGAVVKAQGF